MPGNSVIGALRVDLGLNSAQFDAGLKEAQGSLAKFGSVVGTGLAAVALAAVSATAALGVAVKGAIDHADALSKSAQKAGLTVEALSRLEYAANLSDVSLEELTKGLGKLSQSMVSVAQGAGGTAKAAFAALGIAIKDANGQLRPTNDVLDDVADRFSRMRDGSVKTALAIQIFGKAGAELIPLLNGGRDALKQFADESDRTGNTISTSAAQASETFNDNLTRLQSNLAGLVNTIAMDVVPELATLSGELVSASGNFDIAKIASEGLKGVFKDLALFAVDVSEALQETTILTQGLGSAFEGLKNGQGGLDGFFKTIKASLDDYNAAAAEGVRKRAVIEHGVSSNIELGKGVGAPASAAPPPFVPTITDQAATAAADAAQKKIDSVTKSLALQTRELTENDRQKAIDQELTRAGVDVSTKQGKAIEEATGKLYDQKLAIEQNNAAMSFFAQTAESGIESLIDGSKSFTDVLGDVAKALEAAVLQAALLGSGPLGNIFGGAPTTAGQTGGILGTLLSGLASAAVPGRASGGPVSAGMPYVVGEHGKELFVPQQSGSIVPRLPANSNNHSAANSNGPVSINLSIVHQPGADDSASAKQSGNSVDIVAIVGGAGAKDMSNPGGQMNRAMRVGFGLRQQLTKR